MNEYLKWVSDDSFIRSADALIIAATNAIEKSGDRFQKNVPDPFTSLVIATTLSIDNPDSLVRILTLRSGLQGVSNAIGAFHQSILGSVNGWVDHNAGYDLENSTRKIIAEVKNKHNTMNASNKSGVISELETGIRQKGRGWTGYLVYIVPRRPIRFINQISTTRSLYEIDGASFYELVTGREFALRELYFALETHLHDQHNISNEIKNLGEEILSTSIPR